MKTRSEYPNKRLPIYFSDKELKEIIEAFTLGDINTDANRKIVTKCKSELKSRKEGWK